MNQITSVQKKVEARLEIEAVEGMHLVVPRIDPGSDVIGNENAGSAHFCGVVGMASAQVQVVRTRGDAHHRCVRH